MRVYAKADIPEYWLVDLNEDVVRVHTEPLNGIYRTVVNFRREQSLTPRFLSAYSFAAIDLLGPRTS